MRPTTMTARELIAPSLALTLGLLLAACGGDGSEERLPVRLTDPRSVPTATPWSQPPEPIILEPGALTPTIENGDGENGENGENGNGGAEVEVTPVTPFRITSGESTNLRAAPSTEGAVLGTIAVGEEGTVTGQATGEAVEEGNDIWYQLDDGSFVYSGAVTEVEE